MPILQDSQHVFCLSCNIFFFLQKTGKFSKTCIKNTEILIKTITMHHVQNSFEEKKSFDIYFPLLEKCSDSLMLIHLVHHEATDGVMVRSAT